MRLAQPVDRLAAAVCGDQNLDRLLSEQPVHAGELAQFLNAHLSSPSIVEHFNAAYYTLKRNRTEGHRTTGYISLLESLVSKASSPRPRAVKTDQSAQQPAQKEELHPNHRGGQADARHLHSNQFDLKAG